MAPTSFSADTDYDGRDLRDVLADDPSIEPPPQWPLNPQTATSRLVVHGKIGDQRANMSVQEEEIDQKDIEMFGLGVMVHKFDDFKDNKRWVAAYAHFENLNSLSFYLDTIGRQKPPSFPFSPSRVLVGNRISTYPGRWIFRFQKASSY